MSRVAALTTTSYAVLGLLAVRPASGYDLAKQMERSLRVIWPRAESRLYEEPKKLVVHGLARSVTAAEGRRRTVYTITAAGRRALSAWLTEPSAPPELAFEGLLRVFYSDHGPPADLVSTLEQVAEQASARLAVGQALAQEYVEGRGPYPERMHINALVWEYLRRHHQNILEWATWARDVAEGWEDTASSPAKQATALAIYRAGSS